MTFFQKKKNVESKKNFQTKSVGRIVIDISQDGENRNINVNIEGNLPIDTAYVALDVAKNSIVKGGPVPMGKVSREDISYVG